jgi:hypothetical protein
MVLKSLCSSGWYLVSKNITCKTVVVQTVINECPDGYRLNPLTGVFYKGMSEREFKRTFRRASQVLLHSFLVQTSIETSLQKTFSGPSAQLPRSDEHERRAFRRPSLFLCKTHSSGQEFRRRIRRPSRVRLHSFLVRTRIQTSLLTTFSGPSAQLPRPDEY